MDFSLLKPTAISLLRVVERFVGIAIVVVTALVIKRALRDAGAFEPKRFAILALPALLPFLWLELLQKHSLVPVHAVTASRSTGAAIGVLLAAWVLSRAVPAQAVIDRNWGLERRSLGCSREAVSRRAYND